ncbi:DUF2877 domain-containing protein [Actinomycetospora cinnamomea]|uniref:Uncharacterized protein DUF2877 n=1 Tax=Actinomycetospora cinnamomea TaxID=663609 RepID=A0A2U1F411_9PSEU|nr:DUF2877 domain-containing protein [Actinomycetospora cinnamomea]PVZ06911.1 uncharacterized protein DUF2877 [Actinomycetospora cinnamomea]
MVPVVDVGEGAHAVLARPSRGRVVAVYRRAAYLHLDGGIVALTDTSAPAGPRHVRCTVLPRLREGFPVASDGVRLTGGEWALRVDGPVWRGELPDPDALAWAREVHPEADGVAVEPAVAALVRAGRIEDLAAAVGGRGPGLTPAGDDLLAGVLVVARLWWGAGSRLDAVAGAVSTTEIARAFLVEAARGRCIAPAHDWLVAVAAGRADDALRASRRLRATGASSGAHLAAGLGLAVSQLPRTASQTARAGPDPVACHRAGRSPG